MEVEKFKITPEKYDLSEGKNQYLGYEFEEKEIDPSSQNAIFNTRLNFDKIRR